MSSMSDEVDRQTNQSHANKAMKKLFMKGLPIDNPSAKLTPQLKKLLNARLSKVEDFVYGGSSAGNNTSTQKSRNGTKSQAQTLRVKSSSTGFANFTDSRNLKPQSISSISNAGFVTTTENKNPFSLQLSRSRANILAFHSTNGKRNTSEVNAYKDPQSRMNGGLMTHDISVQSYQNTPMNKLSRGRSNPGSAPKTSKAGELQKGLSFAKMRPRDDLLYRVSEISFIRKRTNKSKQLRINVKRNE